MSKQKLQNLVKINQLKLEASSRAEFEEMSDSARKRLADSRKEALAFESRFDLAYGAARAHTVRGFSLGVRPS